MATKSGPGRIRGYHVTRLIVPHTDLIELVIGSRRTKSYEVETFYNNDLGVEWAAEDAALTDAQLDRACAMGDPPQTSYQLFNPVTMGVDVASRRDLSVRISEVLPDGRRKALWIGDVADFERVEELMADFAVHMAVIDHLPETRAAMALANRLPGRVFLCAYDENWTAKALRVDFDRKLVTVNRTQTFDAMMDAIRHLRNLPLSHPPEGYYQQMKAPKRRREEDTKGRERRVYVSTGPDDLAHAENYDLVAHEMLSMMQAAQADAIDQGPAEIEDLPTRSTDPYHYDPGFEEET